MTEDFLYSAKRMQLLFEQLKWMLEKQQLGLSAEELSERMQLGNWEAQHLFQEYLGKDPIRFVHDAFSPSLLDILHTQQVSIFDDFDKEGSERNSIPVEIEGISEADEISFTTFTHFLGKIFIAATEKGICQLTFEDSENGFNRLRKTFPTSNLIAQRTIIHEVVYRALRFYFVSNKLEIIDPIPIAVKGSPLQLEVWRELSQLKPGELTTFERLAEGLGDSKISRLVGTAIGYNPVALLIPCHRIMPKNNKVGTFRWGVRRKQIILAIEK